MDIVKDSIFLWILPKLFTFQLIRQLVVDILATMMSGFWDFWALCVSRIDFTNTTTFSRVLVYWFLTKWEKPLKHLISASRFNSILSQKSQSKSGNRIDWELQRASNLNSLGNLAAPSSLFSLLPAISWDAILYTRGKSFVWRGWIRYTQAQ